MAVPPVEGWDVKLDVDAHRKRWKMNELKLAEEPEVGEIEVMRKSEPSRKIREKFTAE